jgi:hypothetical protein
MRKFFSVKHRFWEILVLLILAFIPTSFLLKSGLFLNGDAVFPLNEFYDIPSPFFTWREGDLGSDFWEHIISFPLRSAVYFIFNTSDDFTQFIYYFIIFFLGALGIYYLSELFLKTKMARFSAVMLYLVNFWTIMRLPHNYLLQSYFLIPLLMYLYLKYLRKGQVRYLLFHTLLFPFLGAIHGYWLYFLILLIWNFVDLIYSGKNYKKRFLLSLRVAILGVISLSFFLFPMFYTLLKIPSSQVSLFSSREFFADNFAYTYYSQDQNVFNSFSLLSPSRIFNFIDGAKYSMAFLKLVIIAIPFLLSILLISFGLFLKKLNRYFLFLIILFLTGVFLSSFHFISNSEWIKKIVFIVFPPLSVDTNMALPLAAIPFAIMISFSLEHLWQLRKEKFIRFFLILPVLLLFFGLVFLVNNSLQFSQVTDKQLEKVTRFRNDIDENSYLLVYPISTMFQLSDLPYPIYNIVFFNHHRQISFIPIQTTLPRTRNFIFPEINLEKNTFNPEILKQLGIGQVMLVKNAGNVNYKVYQKLVDFLVASGYKVVVNNQDGLLLKTEDYKPNIYASRFLIFSDTDQIDQFDQINNFEDEQRGVLLKNNGLFVDKDNFKKLYLFYQNKGNFNLSNGGSYEINAGFKSLTNNQNFSPIIIDDFKIDKLPFTIELEGGLHNYEFNQKSFDWLSMEMKSGDGDPLKIENTYHPNPTSFKIFLKADKPFWLVFNQSFQNGWQAYLKPYHKEEFTNDGLTSINFIKSLKQGIPLSKHSLVNGFSNGWFVSEDDLGEFNNLNEFEIELIYKPQVFYELGGLFTVIFLFLILGFFIKSFLLKENENK